MPVAIDTTLPTLADLERAADVVYAAMPPTPQYAWPLLSRRCGGGREVWVKHENHTPVGAFKVRGGLVYLDHLLRAEPGVEGIVSATRGNHGQALGFAAGRGGVRALVVVPHGNSVEKNAAMRALGVDLVEEGSDFQESVEVADRIAAERGWHRVPSFHRWLVEGAGTYGLELFRHAPALDTVYVSIGLGSGICGTIAARDALGLATRIVGVVSAGAMAYAESLAKGRVVSSPVTTRIADGLACRTPVAEAVGHIARGVERIVAVTDDEVEEAMRALFSDTHNVAEGAAGAGLAGLLRELREGVADPGGRVGVVLTGGNVDRGVVGRVLAGEPIVESSRS